MSDHLRYAAVHIAGATEALYRATSDHRFPGDERTQEERLNEVREELNKALALIDCPNAAE